jgi:hypothetical protein
LKEAPGSAEKYKGSTNEATPQHEENEAPGNNAERSKKYERRTRSD